MSHSVAGPEILSGPASCSWRRTIGLPYDSPPRSVYNPVRTMVDDGPWTGAPVGGMGGGSIGRTYRGDFARWHLEPGCHRFRSVAADQFSVFCESRGGATAHVLSTIRPDRLRGWNWDVEPGCGTYHALFPFAWFDYDSLELPVRLLQRQFSPLIPDDYEASSLPVAIFEWQVSNPTSEQIVVSVMFSWENEIGAERGRPRAAGRTSTAVRRDGMAGAVLEGEAGPRRDGWRGSFALVAPEQDGVMLSISERFDADADERLWADFASDGVIGTEPASGGPAADGEAIGAAVAAKVALAPGETRVLPFALAWDLPIAEFGAGTRWRKRYTRFFGADGTHAWEIAATGLRRRREWAARIEAWQAPIVADPGRPEWYKTALFNELYYLLDGGTVWTDGPPDVSRRASAAAAAGEDSRDASDPEVGHFALLECFDYVFYNTLDVAFYSSWATMLLWPMLDRAVLRDFIPTVDREDREERPVAWTGGTAPRLRRGAVPHDVGGPREDPFLRPNLYGWRDTNIWKDLNSKFVLQIWRDVTLLADVELASESWPAVVSAIDYLARFDRDGDGVPENDGDADQTYDTWSMRGPSAYCGFLWIGALRAAAALGRAVGDGTAAARFEEIATRAEAAVESRLWTGSYYRYDASGTGSSESVMADQLAGQWYADATGLGDLAPAEHVDRALRTIYERNVLGFEGGRSGAVNGTRPDGSLDRASDQSVEMWIGVTYALAALMLGRGLVDEAWRTAWGAYRVTYENGLWFRTPEALGPDGFRAGLYLRPLSIWAIEHALSRIDRREERRRFG